MARTAKKTADQQALRQQIHQRAYAIWESQGRPHGHDLAHWLQAETELTAATRPTARPAKPRRRKDRSGRQHGAADT